MTTLQASTTDFRAHFEGLGFKDSPNRLAALERFEAIGIPSMKHEEWKYTNLRELAETRFTARRNVTVSAAQIQPYRLREGGIELVFVNGAYSAALSSSSERPKGLRVESLADVVAPELGAIAKPELNPFCALNTALWEDGAYVHVAKGAIIEEPIHLLFFAQGDGEPQAIHPRILIFAEPESRARIVETYVGEGVSFTNPVTEIVVGAGAVLEHTKVQEETETAFHIATIEVRQAAGSTFNSNNVQFGAKLARNDVNVFIDGEHCETWLNGASAVFREQLIDNHTRIDHAMPNCHSFEVYKGILGDKGVGIFNGKIYVHLDAQKTDAKQTNKALLLSRQATMNTKPQLEIYADDVKCTHGATVGQLDDEQLFYLRSRGLSMVEAKTLLTYAFVSEVLAKVTLDSLRERLEARLMECVRNAHPEEK